MALKTFLNEVEFLTQVYFVYFIYCFLLQLKLREKLYFKHFLAIFIYILKLRQIVILLGNDCQSDVQHKKFVLCLQ